jgi:hypothetical protein
VFTVWYSMSFCIKQTHSFLKGLTTNSMEHSPPEKLTDPHLTEKFPALYGTRKFIAAFTRACHLSLF